MKGRGQSAFDSFMNPFKKSSDDYQKHVAENSGDYQVKSAKYENLIAKILCVLAAVVLWFYVVITDNTTDEKTFTGIKVDIRNINQIEEQLGLSLISGYDYTVDITVRGTKSELNRLEIEDISAYVDAKDINAAGEYTLPIRTSLPNGITTGSMSVNYITIYVDKRTTISVPIEVITSQTIESDYTLGTPELDIESVNVTGPAEELAKVDRAVAYFDLGRVSKTLLSTGKLELVDKNGVEITNPYVKLQTSEVTVKFPVYTFKDVPLTVEYKYGYYNDSNVDVTINPSAIRIKGDPDVLSEIDSIVLTSLDEKKITGDITQEVTIMLPDDVENVSGIRSATVTVTHKNTETRELEVTNISVLNPNNLDYTLADDSITVCFRSTKNLLSLLNSNNVTATIDLGYLNNASGTVSVPVTISVVSALAGHVYEIGEYKMDVTIN